MTEDEKKAFLADSVRKITESIRAGEAAIADTEADLLTLRVTQDEADALYRRRVRLQLEALDARLADPDKLALSVAYQVSHHLSRLAEPHATAATRAQIDAKLSAVLRRLDMPPGHNPVSASEN